mgnify:CR=1 FL=1
MDGLRVGIKNQVRQQSNQYLRSPNVNRSDEFKVSLRGWLYRLEGAAIKQWKRRWCVLADYCLFYYKGNFFLLLSWLLVRIIIFFRLTFNRYGRRKDAWFTFIT